MHWGVSERQCLLLAPELTVKWNTSPGHQSWTPSPSLQLPGVLAQGDEDTLAVLGHDPLLQPLLLRWVSVPALNQQEAGAGVWVSEVLDSHGTFSVNFSWRKETV